MLTAGGLTIFAYDPATKKLETVSAPKKIPDRLQQICVNHIKGGIYYELDEQLLYDKGVFDLNALPKIDAPVQIMDEIIKQYKKSNGNHISFF